MRGVHSSVGRPSAPLPQNFPFPRAHPTPAHTKMADPPPIPALPPYLLLPTVGQGDVCLALPPPIARRPGLNAECADAARPTPAALSSLAHDQQALARARELLAATHTDHL